MALLVAFGIIVMAWYDAGAGAGVWDNAIINPSLKNILHQLCTAVNEREIYRGSSLTVTSITRSGTTATLTAAANHGLATGAKVYVFGADQSEYNGLVTITVTGATTFTYTVSGSPATPATGTIKYRKPSSSFTYNENGDQKMFPAVADFVGLPLSRIGTGPARTVAYSFTPTSITRLFTVATINTTAEIIAKVTVGDSIEITGADQSEYNGVWAVISKGATSFTVDIGTTPSTPATGTITVRHYARMTRSGSTVTVWLRASGLKVGDRVEIAGAAESDYNGWQTVTAIPSIVVTSITRSGGTATVNTSAAHGLGVGDVVAIEGCAQAEYNKFATIASVPTSTSFTYAVSGSPATPATGSPNCNDLTRFQFTTSATPSSPATGSITATAHRHLVAYAEYSGGTTTFQCYEHGLTTGDYLEVVSSNSGSADMHEYGAVTVTNSNTFTMSTASFGGSPHIAGISDFMWAVPEGKFRRLLRELQTAIAGLLTASMDAGAIRYVEDSSPYETNYTLANLLGAGSYGSSWVSLKGLSRGELANVLMQMQDALDLLTTTTVNDTATHQSHDRHRSREPNDGVYSFSSISESGGVFTVTTNANHFLETGDYAYLSVDAPAGLDPAFWDSFYRDTVTKVDSDTFTMPTTDLGGSPSSDYCYCEFSLETAWDNATGGSPYNTASDSTYVSRRYAVRDEFASYIGPSPPTFYYVTVDVQADAIFSISKMEGTFVAGSMYLQQSNNGGVTQDSYTLTDSDGDTASINASLGTTDGLVTVSKTSAFFGSSSKTLTFTTPTPASNPFSTAMTGDDYTIRYVKVRTTNACKHTRELAPGTHLTYG